MIRSSFRFERPDTLDEALRLLGDADESGCVLGGGSVLVPLLSAGLTDPTLVLDLSRLGFNDVGEVGEDVVIGSTATYTTLAASGTVRTRLPLLAAMVAEVTGGPGLWNLATLGGSACHANPASDGPGCLTALGARFQLASTRGTRLVPATLFFTGPFSTAREPDEILTHIVVPTPQAPGRTAYLKLKHATSSWPIVTASCLLSGEGGRNRLRLCLGGTAAVPSLAEWEFEGALGPKLVSAFAREAFDALQAEWTDELAGPGYRRSVARTMAERALRAVAGRDRMG